MSNDYAALGPHGSAIEAMVKQIDDKAATINQLISRLAVKPGEITETDLENARLRNPRNDKDIAKRNDMIAKAQKSLAELIAQTNELARQDVEQPLDETEKPKVQEQVKNLTADYKKMSAGLEGVAMAFGLDISNVEVKPIVHMSGRKTGGNVGAGAGIPKIRTKEVYVNDSLIQVKKPGKDNEFASTLSGAATELSKLHKVKITASDIQKSYFSAAGTEDTDSLPLDITFPFTFKDLKGEEVTVNVRAVRS